MPIAALQDAGGSPTQAISPALPDALLITGLLTICAEIVWRLPLLPRHVLSGGRAPDAGIFLRRTMFAPDHAVGAPSRGKPALAVYGGLLLSHFKLDQAVK